MSEIYGSDFRLKIIQEGLCMARRKIKDKLQTKASCGFLCAIMQPV